jgi:hypothetical protein
MQVVCADGERLADVLISEGLGRKSVQMIIEDAAEVSWRA